MPPLFQNFRDNKKISPGEVDVENVSDPLQKLPHLKICHHSAIGLCQDQSMPVTDFSMQKVVLNESVFSLRRRGTLSRKFRRLSIKIHVQRLSSRARSVISSFHVRDVNVIDKNSRIIFPLTFIIFK